MRFSKSILHIGLSLSAGIAVTQAIEWWLAKCGIYYRRYFYPLLTDFAPYVYARNTCPIAQDIASRVLTLPTYYGLPLVDVKAVHRQQLEHRMAGDTDEQAEKEEAVFTSGAVIGSESFVTKIVKSEEEAFPAGHKTPPVNFGIGGVVLKTLLFMVS